MQETADVFLNYTSDLHVLVLTNVLKVLKPSSFALITHGLKAFIVIFCVCFVRSKFKLSVSSNCKGEYRYFEYVLKAASMCLHRTFPLKGMSLQSCEPPFSFFFFFVLFCFSLNKIRFAKTQCEFGDYEFGC